MTYNISTKSTASRNYETKRMGNNLRKMKMFHIEFWIQIMYLYNIYI